MELVYMDHTQDWTKGWLIYKENDTFKVFLKDEVNGLETDLGITGTLEECIAYITKNNN